MFAQINVLLNQLFKLSVRPVHHRGDAETVALVHFEQVMGPYGADPARARRGLADGWPINGGAGRAGKAAERRRALSVDLNGGHRPLN